MPVAGEPLGRAGGVRRRPPVRLPAQRRRARRRPDAGCEALAAAGHPRSPLSRPRAARLGRIFFFSEFATAVAGWVLGINPFDQPNVQEAKDNTDRVLERYAADGALPDVADADDDALRALLRPPRRRTTSRSWATSQPLGGVRRRRSPICAARSATATGCGHDVRLRPALPALDRPAAQGRAGDRRLPPADARWRRGRARSPTPATASARSRTPQATGDLQTLRAHGLPAERVRLTGRSGAAVGS